MAKFYISDFIHLGIDVGIEKVDWIISLTEDNTQIIITEERTGGDLLILEHNMKLQVNPLFPEMNIDELNEGKGVYWNGDCAIYVSVRITMNGKTGDWTQKKWTPLVEKDGFYKRLSNPIRLEDIESYTSHQPRVM